MSKVIIYTDGASKGNPGDAGIGVVIAAEDGAVLKELAEYIGITTNNVAEYTALIRGLEESAKLGATEVQISTDSQLMAFQLTGVYKVKSPKLQPLHQEALALLRCFRSVSISHVVRELNQRADKLANDGVKKKLRVEGGERRVQKGQAEQRAEGGGQRAQKGQPEQGEMEF